ncbi:MAG TPA: hypothetical protein VJG64_03055 [Candidatus Paceibacterota bacterium]
MRKHFSRAHARVLPFSNSIHVKLFVVSSLILIFAIALSVQAKAPFSSAEVHFADASPGGLQIIPASCPSDPHWVGECSTPESSCTTSVSPASMIAGSQSEVYLTWNTGALAGGYAESTYTVTGSIAPIGYVYPWGTSIAIGAPAFDTTYTYYGAYTDIYGNNLGSFSCSTTLTVTGGTNPLYISKVKLFGGSGTTIAVGDVLSYRMYIENKSTWQTQTNLTVTDAIPAGTHLTWQGGGTDSSSASPAGSTGNLWWLQNSALPGWSGYVDFNVQVDTVANGTLINNIAYVVSDQWPAVPSNTISNEVYTPVTPVCTGYVDWAYANGPAYKAWGGISDRRIDYNTTPICIANWSGNDYFVPAKTSAEIDSFKAHLPPGTSIAVISPPPTATLTSNGSTDLTVNVGDTLNHVWSSTGGSSYSSAYTGSPSSCGSGTWITGNTASGSPPGAVVAAGSSGCTYTVTYTVTGPGGSTAATLYVRVRALPTAILTATANGTTVTGNGTTAGDITVSVGDTINYTWSSANGSTYSSSYASNYCGFGTWSADTSSAGSSGGVVATTQSGCTYVITYYVTGPGGSARADLYVRVRALVMACDSGGGGCTSPANGNYITAYRTDYITYTTDPSGVYGWFRVQDSACGNGTWSTSWTTWGAASGLLSQEMINCTFELIRGRSSWPDGPYNQTIRIYVW